MLKLIIVVAILAVAIYTVIRLLQGHGTDKGPTPPPRRPVAPDDDHDFLRGLDRKRKQRGESDT